MSIARFTYFVQDTLGRTECLEEIGRLADIELTDELTAKITEHPFYEVGLECTIDTETGVVTVVGAST